MGYLPNSIRGVIVSTHGSLAGADTPCMILYIALDCFNSRLPCGSRRAKRALRNIDDLFQLTAPLREPTRRPQYYRPGDHVSTHGSLAGADLLRIHQVPASSPVSTHGSLAGADCTGGRGTGKTYGFNSRLPCGSRQKVPDSPGVRRRFNSRLPCGSRLQPAIAIDSGNSVSTHGSLAGADSSCLSGRHSC